MKKKEIFVVMLMLLTSLFCMGFEIGMTPKEEEMPENLMPPQKKSGIKYPMVAVEASSLEITNGVGQPITVEVLTSDETVVVHCVTYDGKVSLSYLESGVEYTLLLYMNGMWWTGTFSID